MCLETAARVLLRRPARYDDAVLVRSRLTELGSRGLTFSYAIADQENRILAEGTTRHVFADASGRPRRAPAEILDRLARFRES